MAIGLVGLVSYFLAPDLLFGWANSTRMAIHTATCVIIASTGLWVTWSRAEWYSGERFFHEGEKIRLLSAAVAVVITITAGLTGFVLLQSNFESALEGRLTGIVKMRGPWLQALATGIARSSENAAEATGLPLLGTKLAPAEGAVDLSEAARKLLRNGIRSVTFKDGAGNVLARFGRRSEQAVFDAPLDATGDLTLIWDQELRIRSRHRLDSSVARMSLAAESVVLESEARQIAPLLFDVEGLGRTAEVSACQAHGDTLICLPNVRHEVPFTAPMKSPPMRPLPIQLAMDGAAPGVMHAVDYRGHDVIAAYGTLSPKIGFVAKQDGPTARR